MTDPISTRLPWRCDVTGNPVGTDTVRIGYKCQCQGCRAADTIDELCAALERSENYISNTEGELGITLDCGAMARAALAKARGADQ